jgi:hypothetical protein
MTREPENEIIAGKDLNEIIAAAKELGIKLTNAKPGSELWEEAWGDPAKHAKLCVDDGRTDECKAAIEDANACATAFSEQAWCGAVHSLWESC